MRFVPTKSVEQQAILSMHRVRQGFIEERTATINPIHGLMSEFGVVLPARSIEVKRGARAAAVVSPSMARQAIEDLMSHLATLDERVASYDRQLEAFARSNETVTHLMSVPGVGPLSALATVATVGRAREFRSSRQFAAWLGLVPRQWSTGGKMRLGRITKRDDGYLRTLLIMGARQRYRWPARAMTASAAGRCH